MPPGRDEPGVSPGLSEASWRMVKVCQEGPGEVLTVAIFGGAGSSPGLVSVHMPLSVPGLGPCLAGRFGAT